MKKYLFICLALMSAALIWAEEAAFEEPRLDIEGNATVSWGIDLGKGTGNADDRDQKHGFKNEMSWKVKFPIIKKGNKTSGRKEDAKVYGELTLKDIELAVESKHDEKDFKPTGKVDNLEAKFVFFGAYLQVYNAPSFKTNYANFWEPIVAKTYYHKDDYKFEPGFDGYGIKLGYKYEPLGLDVGVKVGSNGHWESKESDGEIDYKAGAGEFKNIDATAGVKKVGGDKVWIAISGTGATPGQRIFEVPAGQKWTVLEYKKKNGSDGYHSKYALGLDFSIKPLGEKLDLALTFNTLFDKADAYKKGLFDKNLNKEKVYMNFGTEVKSTPIKDLTFKLGFDGGWAFESFSLDKKAGTSSKPDVFAWDMLFDTKYKWISTGLYVASEGTPYYGWKENDEIAKRTPDMGMYIKFETKEDLVKNLNAGAYLGMYNFITTANRENANSRLQLPLAMKLWANYKIGIGDTMWVKPFFEFWGETKHTNHTGHRNSNSNNKNWEEWDVDPYFGIAYNVGVTYSPVEKVEITAKWNHGKIKDDRWHMIEATANHNNHNGTFVLSCKVIY